MQRILFYSKFEHVLSEIITETRIKEIDIGYASGIKAMRLTHTGEDGFNLYVPTEYSLHVYDILMEKGKMFGLVNAGYFALRTLRIEKMFAFWGQDLDKNTNPYGNYRRLANK